MKIGRRFHIEFFFPWTNGSFGRIKLLCEWGVPSSKQSRTQRVNHIDKGQSDAKWSLQRAYCMYIGTIYLAFANITEIYVVWSIDWSCMLYVIIPRFRGYKIPMSNRKSFHCAFTWNIDRTARVICVSILLSVHQGDNLLPR